MKPMHGGPDALGAAPWDFSTNVNAAGPCPPVLRALADVDLQHYPDAGYHALRQRLAAWHGVATHRILLAASGSEFIQRFTAVAARLTTGPVAVPAQAYDDYARAARACGLALTTADDATAGMRWCCDPSSPLGRDAAPPDEPGAVPTVLDAVYAPLRLQGSSQWTDAQRDQVFVLHSPNKALGLAGVRGAYAIAPWGTRWQAWSHALDEALPSWPLGAHGLALLTGWASAAAQQWLADSLHTLRQWKAAQTTLLKAHGIELQPSVTPFFCARISADAAVLRQHGVKLRDATSFGLPGWCRLSVQPPAAQAALVQALKHTLQAAA